MNDAETRLKAVAPELLEALRRSTALLEWESKYVMGGNMSDHERSIVIQLSKAAIAKATGDDHNEMQSALNIFMEENRVLKERLIEVLHYVRDIRSIDLLKKAIKSIEESIAKATGNKQ